MHLNGRNGVGSMVLLLALALTACGTSSDRGGTNPSPDAGPQLPTTPPTGWELAGTLNTGRFRHTATLLLSGDVLVTGGNTMEGRMSTSAEVYDAKSGIWKPVGRMKISRADHAATRLQDGSVLITGGGDVQNDGLPSGTLTMGTAEKFDPDAGEFEKVAHMSWPRSGHAAVLLDDGKVLVSGGATNMHDHGSPYGIGDALAAAELYDPASDTWTPTGSMNVARMGHRVVKLQNGKVLAFGGIGDAGATILQTELYDPRSGSWSVVSEMPGESRMLHTATLVGDGQVLVTGGLTLKNPQSGHWLADGFVYDPKTDEWKAVAGNLGFARFGHAAAALPTGQVLLAGGTTATPSHKALDEVRIYSPDTNAFATGPALLTSRQMGVATLLANGEVLISGGVGSSDSPVGNCEISTH